MFLLPILFIKRGECNAGLFFFLDIVNENVFLGLMFSQEYDQSLLVSRSVLSIRAAIEGVYNNAQACVISKQSNGNIKTFYNIININEK